MRRPRKARIASLLVLAAGLGVLPVVPVSADYQAGLDAHGRGDYRTAMREWRAVTDGPPTAVNPAIYVEAHYAVAMLYWEGQGVERDLGQARQWLLEAAEMNHSGAQAKLGYLYADGVSVAQDHAQALEWFRKAARGGNVDGLYNLGIFYLYGWGVEQNTTMAAQYLAAASALGDSEAEAALQQVLGQIQQQAAARIPELEPLPDPVPGASPDLDPAAGPDPEPVEADPEAGGSDVAVAQESNAAEAAGEGPKAEPAANPEENSGSAKKVLDEDWIRAQKPGHYTIQVMALRSRDSVTQFMEEYQEFAPFAVFTVQKGEAPLHVMLQGSYADLESARIARGRFPHEIQSQDALWIRRFEMVQRLLE